MRYFERIIFFLLLTSTPIQLGKHFWPQFSFVDGIRVDYLSPTLYLTDLLLIILFALSFKRLRRKFFNVLKTKLLVFTYLVFFLSTFFAASPSASLFGILKFFEMFYFAFYVSLIIKKEFFLLELALTVGAVSECVLLLLQFISQSSLGGLFYFFGERTFSASTIGIAVFPFNGTLILRPYGTFPHPNVAAFYLFVAFVILLFKTNFEKNIISSLKVFILALIFAGFLITFSRIVSLLLMLSTLSYIFCKMRKTKINKYFLFLISSILIAVAGFLIPRLGQGLLKDFLPRLSLVRISWNIFLKNPIFGVGLNNFFYYEIIYQKDITPILLQPVHNIFLLVLTTTGLVGFSLFAIFLYQTYIKSRKNLLFAILFFSIILVGLFDHYLLTLQQGQLMLALVIGVIYSQNLSFMV